MQKLGSHTQKCNITFSTPQTRTFFTTMAFATQLLPRHDLPLYLLMLNQNKGPRCICEAGGARWGEKEGRERGK